MRNSDTIVPNITLAIRWIARIMSIILVGFIVADYILAGRQINFPAMKLRELAMTISLLAAVAGLLIGWASEAIGGFLTIAGLLTFSIVNFLAGGDFPWAIWIMALPAALFIIYWWRVN